MKTVSELSWGETSFRAKLKLFSKSRKDWRLKDSDKWRQAEGYSALSSTCHSIYGTALAQLKVALKQKWLLVWLIPIQLLVWCLTWLPLAMVCYWYALPSSNRVVELMGYGKMSAEMCDVRQSILRSHGKRDEAVRCINIALDKPSLRLHTRGLLHVGLAEIYRREGSRARHRNKVKREVQLAVNAAKEARKTEPRQAARIYRHCADLADYVNGGKSGDGDAFRNKASRLAEATGAKDQLLKI